jgi:hypothetical protein
MSNSIYTPNTKQCSKCKEIKSIGEFNKKKSSKDGHNIWCSSCTKEYKNQYYINNKEYIIKKNSKYIGLNIDRLREYKRKYRQDNAEKISKYMKDYYHKNYEKNIDKTREYKRKYRKDYASYMTYKDQLTTEEDPRLADDGASLEVRCKYCGDYFKPTNIDVTSRISVVVGKAGGGNNLYCSTGCKKSCGTFGQKAYPKGHKINTSREVQPVLRKLVLERDNWTCQMCHKTKEQSPLHCHHTEGIEINPIESADMDICITLCKECHKEIHKRKDCNMRRKSCDT